MVVLTLLLSDKLQCGILDATTSTKWRQAFFPTFFFCCFSRKCYNNKPPKGGSPPLCGTLAGLCVIRKPSWSLL